MNFYGYIKELINIINNVELYLINGWCKLLLICNCIKEFLTPIYNLLLNKTEWIMGIIIITSVFFISSSLSKKNKYEIKKILGSSFKNLLLIVTIAYLTSKYADKNIIGPITKYYNSMIFLGGALIGIYIAEVIAFYKGERYKISKKYWKYVYYVFSLYLYAIISINLLDALTLIYILTVWLLADLLANGKENEIILKDIDNIDESDCPCTKKEQLFKSRQQELTHIVNYIKEYKYNESFAISIAGEWGEGKTSIMNVLEKEISDDNRFIISIQPMIVDNRESLAKYFFNKLEELFNSYGIYTGKGSALKEYLESIMNIIGTKKNVLINKILDVDTKTTDDYREKKKLLQKDINQLIEIANNDKKGNRIIILIDDFDRVDETVIYSVLTFIKEIVDFRGFIVIFLMDYQKLKNKDINYEYLDKFINKRFDLKKIDKGEIFEYYSSIFLDLNLKSQVLNTQVEIFKNNMNTYFDNIFLAAQEVINKFEKQEKEKIKLYNNEKNSDTKDKINEEIQELKALKNEFEKYVSVCNNSTNNTRKLKKMLRDIRDIFKQIDTLYIGILQEKLDAFCNLINGNKIIFNIIFIKTFIEKEYDIMIDSTNIGVYYKNIGSIPVNKRNNEQLVINEIISTILNKNSIFENDNNRNDKVIKFINNIFVNNETYDSLMDLETRDEKNLKIIDSEDIEISEEYYKNISELYESIATKQWDDGNEKTIKRLNIMSKYIFNQVNNGNIPFWEVINLINSSDKLQDLIFINQRFLYKLEEYLMNLNGVYMDKKQKEDNEYVVRVTKDMVMFKKYSLIAFVISIAKIEDKGYSYKSIVNDIDQYKTLDGINDFANRVLDLKDEFKNCKSIDNFKKWTEKCINYAHDNLSQYNYINIEYLKDEVERLVYIFYILDFIENKISTFSIKEEYITKDIYGINNYYELKSEMEKLRNHILANKNNINEHIYGYFRTILIKTQDLSESTTMEPQIISDLDEIYNNLKEVYNEKLFDYMAWQYCGSILIKININYKQYKGEVDAK